MSERRPSRNTAPAYAWTCHVCAAYNPPGRDHCVACGNAANISMAEMAAARAGATQAANPLTPAAHSEMPDPRPGQATSPAAGPPHARKQWKTGRFWFYAAAVVGCAVLIAGVLVWGANGPLLPGAGAPTVTRGYWNLSDWAGLGALAVLVLGLPCAALLAFVGVAYRHNPKAPWWIAAFLLGALGLKAIGWYRDATMAEQESYGPPG